MSKITITSTVPYTISWYYPEQRINNLFTPKKRSFFIEEEVLKELLFYPGVKNCFESGALVMSDEDRIKVGLGSEDPELDKDLKPTILSEEDMKELMTNSSVSDFRKTLETLSKVQIEKLVQFAIDNKLTDYTKCHILKNRTGRDIVEIIRLTDESEIEE